MKKCFLAMKAIDAKSTVFWCQFFTVDKNMFTETIEGETKRVWKKIARNPLTNNFYLAGGTALALQLGHRKSIDL